MYEPIELLPTERYAELSDLASEATLCQECGADLPPKNRKWCSRRCKDKNLYRSPERKESIRANRKAHPQPSRAITEETRAYRKAWYQKNKSRWQQYEQTQKEKRERSPEENERRRKLRQEYTLRYRIKKRKEELERRSEKKKQGHIVPPYRASTKPKNIAKREQRRECQAMNIRVCSHCIKQFSMTNLDQDICKKCESVFLLVGE